MLSLYLVCTSKRRHIFVPKQVRENSTSLLYKDLRVIIVVLYM